MLNDSAARKPPAPEEMPPVPGNGRAEGEVRGGYDPGSWLAEVLCSTCAHRVSALFGASRGTVGTVGTVGNKSAFGSGFSPSGGVRT